MSSLDWILFIVGLLCVLRGVWRGAIAQVFSIAGLVGGFALASHAYLALSERLAQAFPQLGATESISFALLFLLTWICLAICGAWLARLFHRTGLGFVDRIWGFLFGALKAVVVAVIIVSAVTFVSSPESPILRQSRLVPYVYEAARLMVQITPGPVRDLFDAKRKQLMEYWKRQDGGPRSPRAPTKSEAVVGS